MFPKLLLGAFLFAGARAQICGTPKFFHKVEELSSGPSNCFCAASIITPEGMNPSADMIHFSYLLGEGPFFQIYHPAEARCSREQNFALVEKEGECCFSEDENEVCTKMGSSQTCLTSILSLTTSECPKEPRQGVFRPQETMGNGIEGTMNNGGMEGFNGGVIPTSMEGGMAPGTEGKVDPGSGMENNMNTGTEGPMKPGMEGPMKPGMEGPKKPGMEGPMNPGMEGSMNSGMEGPMKPGMEGPINPGMEGSMNSGMEGPMKPGMEGQSSPNSEIVPAPSVGAKPSYNTPEMESAYSNIESTASQVVPLIGPIEVGPVRTPTPSMTPAPAEDDRR